MVLLDGKEVLFVDWWCLWNGDGVAVIAYIGMVWLSGLDSAPI